MSNPSSPLSFSPIQTLAMDILRLHVENTRLFHLLGDAERNLAQSQQAFNLCEQSIRRRELETLLRTAVPTAHENLGADLEKSLRRADKIGLDATRDQLELHKVICERLQLLLQENKKLIEVKLQEVKLLSQATSVSFN